MEPDRGAEGEETGTIADGPWTRQKVFPYRERGFPRYEVLLFFRVLPLDGN